MISVTLKGLTILQFTNLNRFPELLHFSTIRTNGCSINKYSTLNLGFNSGDLPINVRENRNLLCNELELNPDKLIFPKQTHTATVKIISADYFNSEEDAQKHFLNETDAVITALTGVCVAVKTADCVPVLLFDPKRGVVAAVHAGWRGTVQGIAAKTISIMSEKFGSQPSDLWAAVGPSISPDVYEVGEEVWKQFAPEFYRQVHPDRPDKRLLDLWSTNHHQLLAAGIPESQIEVARFCTFSDPDRFFSARRDGIKTGRMATGIMIR